MKDNLPTKEVDAKGNIRYYLNGKLHREDGPAVECTDGSKKWYFYGNLHREDEPAIELVSGQRYW